MKFNPAMIAPAATILFGCATAPKSILPENAIDSPPATTHQASSTARDATAPRPVEKSAALNPSIPPLPTTLQAYEVKESAFSDFGMSVKTNFEVKWGGNVEWMLVTAVAAGSSAARMGLVAGDRIMAIDGRLVTAMNRDAMLDVLFQRKKGDASRLLVFGQKDAFPRFVTLIANRPSA